MAKLECLLTNDVFGSILSQEQALEIADMMQPNDVKHGESLYKAGDERLYTYLLKQGVVKLVKAHKDGVRDVSVFSDGATVAEASLLGKNFFDADARMKGRRG